MTRTRVIVTMALLMATPWVLADDIAEGQRIFMEETFGGNGRTCATCHVPSRNFRLTPANVAQRFATVSQTFDPLFVAESNINLNTLTVSSAVGFPAGSVLRGTSSSGQTVRAKVLTAISSTTYLVYGGISPAFGAGRSVSDGTRTTKVVSIVRGNLNQLENSRLLRSPSVSPDFPQGRALILENPDGFDKPPVFRKVPHLRGMERAPFGFDNILTFEELTNRAVRQHFTRNMARREGIDFRLPTAQELSAIQAFVSSLSFFTRPIESFNLRNFARTVAQRRGEGDFGGCVACHFDSTLGGVGEDPTQFATGVANLPINGPAPAGDNLPLPPPTDVNFGSMRPVAVPGLFNLPGRAPFFHNNSAATIEDAVRFYTTDTFGNSAGARDVGFTGPFVLTDAQITRIATFLESLVERDYSVEDANGNDLSRLDFNSQDPVLDFGIRSPSAGGTSRTLTVRNISTTASVKFNSPVCVVREMIGSVSAHFTDNCSQLAGATLGPGQTRQITITFDPAAEGVREGILEIGTSKPTGVNLIGEGRSGTSRVDRFDTDTLGAPPGWDVALSSAPNPFRVSDGQLRMTRCTGCQAPNGNILINDFPLPENFDYRIRGIATADSNDSNDFSVIFNMQDPNNPDRDYYYASFNERQDKAGLFARFNGLTQKLAAFPATAPGGSTASLHSIRIEKRGNRIRVFNGSTLYADVIDGNFSGGFVGVGSLNDSGRFDDFVLTPVP